MSNPETGMELTIVGTGAMACLFGARLASAARVTLTGSWTEGIAAIRASGIQLQEAGRCGPTRVAAVAWNEAPPPPADLVLILVKAWQTSEVARRLELLLKPEAIAVTFQNGLGNLETLGPRACLGVTCQGATLLGPGRVQAGGAGPTWIAGPEWVMEVFRRAGIPVERGNPDQVEGFLWGKLAVNCGINAPTALLGIRNGELLHRPDAVRLLRHAARECAEVAHAKGIELPFRDPEEEACEVARLTGVNRSSMLQDVLRGAPTECEAIYGAVVSWGANLGVPTPVNEVLLWLVRALVSKR